MCYGLSLALLCKGDLSYFNIQLSHISLLCWTCVNFVVSSWWAKYGLGAFSFTTPFWWLQWKCFALYPGKHLSPSQQYKQHDGRCCWRRCRLETLQWSPFFGWRRCGCICHPSNCFGGMKIWCLGWFDVPFVLWFFLHLCLGFFCTIYQDTKSFL